ncbi:hypothetical protein HYX06_00925 [Candidatus Woesearchaeota archaeon]|nr:hypothetical protein [Candidatus Woesearchaeota archaeon]
MTREYRRFYNMPLGKFDEGIQKKIDDAKTDARESMKIVGQLNKIMFYARKICQMFGIIYNVVTIWSTITIIEAVATDSVSALPPAAAALYAKKTASCGTEQATAVAADSAWVTGGKFCSFVNCQWAPGVMGRYQNWVTGQINKLPLGEILPGPGQGYDPQQTQLSKRGQGLAGYMDPNNNLGTAFVFACVPGIISGLEKFRQIKCLYADCLENSVAKDGLPAKACEDLKNYAECKYLWGEVFALIPYTAVFDYFTNIIKEALSNPFSALGIGIGAACLHVCPAPPGTSSTAFIACEVARLTSKAGEVLENVQGIYKEGFKIRQDYCSRLDLGEDEEEESEESAPAPATAPSSSPAPSTGNR